MAGTQRSHGPAPRIGGRAVHLAHRGKGETVLLLHGNGSLGNEILSFCPEVSSIEWIAPDRPGFGLSDPPPKGAWDPVSGAKWTEDLICRVAPEGVTLVAHSLSAGQALICAALRPDLIRSLVLLAPFCRPTPHRLMPLLRMASLPGIGIPIRKVAVPVIGRIFGPKLFSRLLKTQIVPSWLTDLPIHRMAGGETMISSASELRAFNAGMRSVENALYVRVPTCVLWGDLDRTAIRTWHLPWLQSRVHDLKYVVIQRAAHLVHHDAPITVLSKIVEYSGRGKFSNSETPGDGTSDQTHQTRP